jgi:type II pantothenate kinase
VGGGTLLGLARHMLGVTRLETLEELAAQGDRSRVDLTVGDITGGSVGIVPASATASNFGKIRSDPTSADKALALMNMVAEVILTISLMAARACRQRTIVLTGKLTRIQPVCSRFTSVRVRSGPCFVVPPHAAYTTAIGAARVLQKRRRS